MASHPDFVAYVCEQIGDAGNIISRKMFGDYGIYCNGKFAGVVCDDQFFVKKTKAGAALFPDGDEAPPYEGAKPHFVIERLDDREWLAQFMQATCSELKEPAPKKKKNIY